MYRGKLSRKHVKIRTNGKIKLPKNYFSKEYIESKSNVRWKDLPKKRFSKKCKIMNQHGEMITLPLEYPGDNVVHQNLNPDRHKKIVNVFINAK